MNAGLQTCDAAEQPLEDGSGPSHTIPEAAVSEEQVGELELQVVLPLEAEQTEQYTLQDLSFAQDVSLLRSDPFDNLWAGTGVEEATCGHASNMDSLVDHSSDDDLELHSAA